MILRVLLLATLLLGATALVPPTVALAQQETLADVVFSEIERSVIRDFFGIKTRTTGKKGKNKGKGGDMPPGLAKRDSLPPGLQMQLERNGRLPPGLEKRNLPPDLAAKLRRRRGFDTLIVDNDVLLVQQATGIIMDILKDVVTK